jgi:integrase
MVTAVLGLRIGETLALRIGDIDFKRKIVRVRQSLDSATRTIQAVKSQASSADVPLPSVLEARLRAHLQSHEGKSELLFVNRSGVRFPQTS